jgi:DNA integrity scanning protein DisA with diadenylate cyclase activity
MKYLNMSIEKETGKKAPKKEKPVVSEQKKEENPGNPILEAINKAVKRAEETRVSTIATIPKKRQKSEESIEKTKAFEEARKLALELKERLNKAQTKDINRIWA